MLAFHFALGIEVWSRGFALPSLRAQRCWPSTPSWRSAAGLWLVWITAGVGRTHGYQQTPVAPYQSLQRDFHHPPLTRHQLMPSQRHPG